MPVAVNYTSELPRAAGVNSRAASGQGVRVTGENGSVNSQSEGEGA